MKKFIVSLICMLLIYSIKSQTIDTSFKSITACKVVPFKAKFTDTAQVTHLGIRVVSDDLKSSCVLYWALCFSNGIITDSGNLTIDGASYTNWNGSNIYPFQFVADKLKLTFK